MGGGLSVAGIELGNVPDLPAAPIGLPMDLILTIDDIFDDADPGVFLDADSRGDLMVACQDVAAELAVEDLTGALVEIQELAVIVATEIILPTLRDDVLESVDLLNTRVQEEIANLAPVAVINGPISPVCPGLYTFTAVSSSDADDRGLFREDIQSYEWTLDGQPIAPENQMLTGTEPIIGIGLAPGIKTVGLTVTDTFGVQDSTVFVVEVVDAYSPVGDVVVEPQKLWPPNHRMVAVSHAARRICRGLPEV